MKVTRIQHSLKDLNKDIGNCERQLSRVLRGKDSQSETARPQSAIPDRHSISKRGYRSSGFGPLPKGGSKPVNGNQKIRQSRSPCKAVNEGERNVICKEIIGDKNAPTRVEVVVRTKSSKKRSRSVQAHHNDSMVPTRDHSSKNRSLNVKENRAQGEKNSSWNHILQQQNLSTCSGNRIGQGWGKVCAELHYSSSDDDHSSIELEKWVQSIPQRKSRSNHKSSCQTANGNQRTQDVRDMYVSSFNPLRTLNFLVKELRGKVHKNHDENMQRIVEDMEKALHCMPFDACHQNSPSVLSLTKLAPPLIQPHHKTSRSRSTLVDACEAAQNTNKSTTRTFNEENDSAVPDCSSNLVNRLMSTVSRFTKITGLVEGRGESNSSPLRVKQSESKVSSVKVAAVGLQVQLEQACKQLEETCRQMEETCENLRQQKHHLLEELKLKTEQLEAAVGKNQQLTLYAADIRQEMFRVQQSAEIAQQEHEKLKQTLLSQQHAMQDSNSNSNQRLADTLQENERLTTELQLCHLEKDKMHILMTNKDLEVAKLKKDIVDISTLVTEQLANLRALSGNKFSLEKLDKMMLAFSILQDSADDSAFLAVTPHRKESLKNHIGDGEGSRSRPVCSSPTSSINSSLYNSWQLMSDITTPTDQNPREEAKEKGRFVEVEEVASRKSVANRDKDLVINSSMDGEKLVSGKKNVNNKNQTSPKNDEVDYSEKEAKSAMDLKAGLREMFNELKKNTSEALNVTLPSPPRNFDRMQETLGLSHWTELSASESTVLFHSSDDSDTDELICIS